MYRADLVTSEGVVARVIGNSGVVMVLIITSSDRKRLPASGSVTSGIEIEYSARRKHIPVVTHDGLLIDRDQFTLVDKLAECALIDSQVLEVHVGLGRSWIISLSAMATSQWTASEWVLLALSINGCRGGLGGEPERKTSVAAAGMTTVA